MLTTQAGAVLRLAVSGGHWPLAEGEAFFGPSRFDISAVRGDASSLSLRKTPCGRGCKVLAGVAGVVAVVTARQVTTRGRLLTHAWSLRVAEAAPGGVADADATG